ncbi:MAG: hypothetical protein ACO31I_07950 [Prochlorotrichaceae cyanobacterium]|jgi:hypothetical protein
MNNLQVQVQPEHEILNEGLQILLQHWEPEKVARFWAACGLGTGDYLQMKDHLFQGETVASLYKEIKAFQETKDWKKE